MHPEILPCNVMHARLQKPTLCACHIYCNIFDSHAHAQYLSDGIESGIESLPVCITLFCTCRPNFIDSDGKMVQETLSFVNDFYKNEFKKKKKKSTNKMFDVNCLLLCFCFFLIIKTKNSTVIRL